MNASLPRRHPRYFFVIKTFFILCAVVFVLLFGIAFFAIISQPHIRSVAFDNSSNWSKHFRSETGFPTLRIHVLAGNRERICCITTVGSGRPADWFENLGFELLSKGEEEKKYVSAIDIFPKDDFPQKVVHMLHPLSSHGPFSYLSKTGVLIHYESVKYK